MEYLTQFSQDFWRGDLPVRSQFCDLSRPSDQKAIDVVDDLLHSPVSVALLDIGKPSENLSLKLPRHGDLFLGLEDLPQTMIQMVTFIFHNHTEIVTLSGTKKGNLWIYSELPTPLLCLGDYETNYVEIKFQFKPNHNWSHVGQDNFKAYFGYFNKAIQYQLTQNQIYELPLVNETPNLYLKYVCGLWGLHTKNDT